MSISRSDIRITVRCLVLYQLQIITGQCIQIFKYRVTVCAGGCFTDTDITAIQIQLEDRTCQRLFCYRIDLSDTDLMLGYRTCGRRTEGYIFDRITRICHILSGSGKVYRIGDLLTAQLCSQTVKLSAEFKDIFIRTDIGQLYGDLAVHNRNDC